MAKGNGVARFENDLKAIKRDIAEGARVLDGRLDELNRMRKQGKRQRITRGL